MSDVLAVLRAWREPMVPAEVVPRARDSRDSDEFPLVSVVTVCFNSAATIQRTIDSVRAQTYPNIEYIVLDGGSSDGTVDVIRANDDLIAEWRSARDGGLYAALNEGVVRSRGRFVQFVHADDWLDPDQIERAVAAARATCAGIVHGELRMHRAQGGHWIRTGRNDWYPPAPATLPQISHPTVFVRRAVYEQIGLFRTDLRIAADVDWLLRAAREGVTMVHDPRLCSNMSEGGVSTRRQRLALGEYAAILAREPRDQARLVAGALYMWGSTLPWLAPVLRLLRRMRASVMNQVSRTRGAVRKGGIALLETFGLARAARRAMRLVSRQVPASVPSAVPVGDTDLAESAARPIAVTPLLREFARIRLERPGLDDRQALRLAEETSVSSPSHEDPVEHR
jgi:glycosyltransferase involved in cell wall biosynthesis